MGRPTKYKIAVGNRFGRLVVTGSTRRGGDTVWLCDCDCGGNTVCPAYRLVRGETKSCGCLKREFLAAGNVRHGESRAGKVTPEYRAWRNMIDRCAGRHPVVAKHYSGRGIRVCEKWLNSYEAFLADVGPRPTAAHTLDRYPDGDGNYEPGNVRWATRAEQARNKRDNVLVRFDGVEMTLTDAAAHVGLPLVTVSMRLIRLKWSIARALGVDKSRVEMIGRRGGPPKTHRSAGGAA